MEVYLKKLMNILLLDFIGYYSVIWNNDYNTGIKYIDGKLVEITEDEFLKDIKSNIDCWKADFHKLRREIKEAFGTIYNEDQKNNPSCRVFENCLYNDFLTIFCRDKLQHDLDFEDTNGKKRGFDQILAGIGLIHAAELLKSIDDNNKEFDDVIRLASYVTSTIHHIAEHHRFVEGKNNARKGGKKAQEIFNPQREIAKKIFETNPNIKRNDFVAEIIVGNSIAPQTAEKWYNKLKKEAS